jgi:hypothetical protein
MPYQPNRPRTVACAATAQRNTSRTVTAQPEERQADGHSPTGAPIPSTQQRKHAMNTHRATTAGIGTAETQSEHEGGEPTHSRDSAPETGRPPAGQAAHPSPWAARAQS